MSKVFAVTSGKGGVGKSTVSFGLSVSFAKLGKKVISVAKIDHPENTVMHSAMEKMGILLVASAEEAAKAFDN